MTAARAHLAIHPERGDGCGRCVRACPGGRLKVGGGYIYVDVQGCVGCFSCVEVCGRAAIVRAPTRPVAVGGKGAPRVVVGSRAEAKALRKHVAEELKRESRVQHPAIPAAVGTRAAASSPRSASEPTTAAPAARWGLVDAAAVAMVLLMSIALKDAALASPAVQAMPPVGRIAAGTAALAVFYAIQCGMLVFLARRHGVGFTTAFRLRTGFDSRLAAASAAVVAVLAVATRVISLAWGAAATAAGWHPPAIEGSSFSAVFGSGPAGLALAVLLAVIVGPLTEELAFRGVIAQAFDERFGRRAAVLGSAGLFAFYHVTPWLFVPMFAFGCALAWLALTRRSLWPAIVLHGLYNGAVVAAAFWLAR